METKQKIGKTFMLSPEEKDKTLNFHLDNAKKQIDNKTKQIVEKYIPNDMLNNGKWLKKEDGWSYFSHKQYELLKVSPVKTSENEIDTGEKEQNISFLYKLIRYIKILNPIYISQLK